MRFATSPEHRSFFSKQHFIEFEGLLSAAECAYLLLKKKERDLWKKDPFVKKIVLRSQFAEIAAELSNQRKLRIGFDERAKELTPLSLQEGSCLKTISLGLIFCLSGEKQGHGTFFSPHIPLSTVAFYDDSFLLAYCENRTFYLLETKDPHTHLLKKEGYAFGDILTNATHPLLKFLH